MKLVLLTSESSKTEKFLGGKFRHFKSSLLRDFLINYAQRLRESSLCNTLSTFSAVFFGSLLRLLLTDRLENDGLC